jgi:teichuronic acid biosynthesis glycosyltransferase TuaG
MDQPLEVIPDVTVVMPAYNAEKYIAATIRSVLAQSFRNFELLVVDDCSKDSTASIVAQFAADDARVRLIRLDRNRGAPAGPRNVAIAQARGEWIAFLDADDIWHPEKLQRQMKALRETGAQFCCTQMRDFVDEGELRLGGDETYSIERISFRQQLLRYRTPTSSVVAKRTLLLNNPFNEDPRYKAREDLDCWLHCIEEAGGGIKLRSPLMGYRIIPGQISGNKLQMMKRHLFVLRRYRLKSGRLLGLAAYLFTFSHFSLALYRRGLRKGMYRSMVEGGIGGRLIVIGSNSKVWRRLQMEAPPGMPVEAISHDDVARRRFETEDRIWILSYSRSEHDNVRLFEALAAAGARHCYYVSTATVNVAAIATCYEYPRVKLAAERDARRILGARIVRIGLVYGRPEELPAGTSAATGLTSLSAALTAAMEGDSVDLFDMVETPFGSAFERVLFALYGRLIRLAGPWPCAMRPLDLLLKMLGMRWYGYVYLSNKLWLSSRSPASNIMKQRR